MKTKVSYCCNAKIIKSVVNGHKICSKCGYLGKIITIETSDYRKIKTNNGYYYEFIAFNLGKEIGNY